MAWHMGPPGPSVILTLTRQMGTMGLLSILRSLVTLFLPVLFPSWRFFEQIGASPRIEVCLNGAWQPVKLGPETQHIGQTVRRLLWNPDRNEALFLTALAERCLTEPGGPAQTLLSARLARQFEDAPFRIWLETGAGRELVFESDGDAV